MYNFGDALEILPVNDYFSSTDLNHFEVLAEIHLDTDDDHVFFIKVKDKETEQFYTQRFGADKEMSLEKKTWWAYIMISNMISTIKVTKNYIRCDIKNKYKQFMSIFNS